MPTKEYFFPELAITLDEYQDYLVIKKIIEYFHKRKNMLFNCLDVINYVKKKKNLLKINSSIKRIDDTIEI